MSIQKPASRLPVSTYRFQLNHLFTAKDAKRIVPYLASLGVTDCYSSCFLKAARGSLHGYDVTDHSALNPEIGTDEDFQNLFDDLKHFGLSLILDVVPNHMGIEGDENKWWIDVLESGVQSPFARFFDIAWDPVKADLRNKILLPVLGDHYGKVLASGEISLMFQDSRFWVRYGEQRFPISIESSAELFEIAIGLSRSAGCHPGELSPEANAFQDKGYTGRWRL